MPGPGLDARAVARTSHRPPGARRGPDALVDLVADRALAALRAHVSQTAHMDDLEGMLRGWLGANAVVAGLADGRLAEGFRIVGTA